jgi:quercetin dioxygenase-like cupin family protein
MIAAVGLVSLSVMAMADMKTSDPQRVSVIRAGGGPSSEAPAFNFTGKVHVLGRFQSEAPARVGGATVTFEPGARTAWHTHPLGQTLIITQGHGFVQEWRHAAEPIGPGDVVWIPAGVKHWHGASAGEAMTHVAIAESQNNNSVTWKEKVSDAQYADAVRGHE